MANVINLAYIASVNEFVVSYLIGNNAKKTILWLAMVFLLAVSWEFIRLVCNYSRIEEHDVEKSIDFKELLLTFTGEVINPREIHVIDDRNQVDYEVEKLLRNANDGYPFPVLGMDAEMDTRDGKEPLIHLLQFATKDGYCVLFRINRFKETSPVLQPLPDSLVPQPLPDSPVPLPLPDSLKNLLEDNNIWKVGINVNEDANDLRKNFGNAFAIGGTFDLRWLARSFNMTERSLDDLTSRILGANKNAHCHEGAWDDTDLPMDKIFYAAMDAYLGILMFKWFFRRYIIEELHRQYLGEEYSARHYLNDFLRKWENWRLTIFSE